MVGYIAAIPNSKDTWRPALTQAIRAGGEELAMALLKKGADLNASDRWGSALTQAIRRGFKKLTRMLLEQPMDSFSKASPCFNKNASMVDHHSTGDTAHIMVSTEGKTIDGKDRKSGQRIRQLGSHMDDMSLRMVLVDFPGMTLGNAWDQVQSYQSKTSSHKSEEPESYAILNLKRRPGQDFKLACKDINSAFSTSVLSASGTLAKLRHDDITRQSQ